MRLTCLHRLLVMIARHPIQSCLPRAYNNETDMRFRARHLFVGFLVGLAAGSAFAQASGLTRTVVGKADVSVPGREAVDARVEVAPGGTVHNAMNSTATPVKLVGVYVVEKGKPLAAPAADPTAEK